MRAMTSLASMAVLLLAVAAPVQAQGRPASAASGASAPMDCGGARMKRHDHGAERGMPGTAGAPCATQPAASAASAPAKARHRHERAKVQKTQ